jgi:hypothetical protein
LLSSCSSELEKGESSIESGDVSGYSVVSETSAASNDVSDISQDVNDISSESSGETSCPDDDITLERTRYDMDIYLDTANKTISETVKITFKNDSGDVWDKVCVRNYIESVIAEDATRHVPVSDGEKGKKQMVTQKCEIESIKDASTGADLRYTVETDTSIVYIIPASPINPGEVGSFEIKLNSTIPGGGYRFSYFIVGKYDDKYSFELGNFYPVLAIYENGKWVAEPYSVDGECFYSKCADYNIIFKVADDFTVIAGGEEEKVSESDGVAEWKITAENMRDVTVVAAQKFAVKTDTVNGVTINSYYTDGLPENLEQGEVSLQAACDAVKTFTEHYGAYPYSELDVVESIYEFGGMETPGLVRISRLYSWFFTADSTQEEHETYRVKLCDTTAHEVDTATSVSEAI